MRASREVLARNPGGVEGGRERGGLLFEKKKSIKACILGKFLQVSHSADWQPCRREGLWVSEGGSSLSWWPGWLDLDGANAASRFHCLPCLYCGQ